MQTGQETAAKWQLEQLDSLAAHGLAGTNKRKALLLDEDDLDEDWELNQEPQQHQQLSHGGTPDKRLKRLLRNRVSAQLARERKRQELNALTDKVKEQQEQITALEHKLAKSEEDNAALRRLIKVMQSAQSPPPNNTHCNSPTSAMQHTAVPAAQSPKPQAALQESRRRKQQQLLALVKQRQQAAKQQQPSGPPAANQAAVAPMLAPPPASMLTTSSDNSPKTTCTIVVASSKAFLGLPLQSADVHGADLALPGHAHPPCAAFADCSNPQLLQASGSRAPIAPQGQAAGVKAAGALERYRVPDVPSFQGLLGMDHNATPASPTSLPSSSLSLEALVAAAATAKDKDHLPPLPPPLADAAAALDGDMDIFGNALDDMGRPTGVPKGTFKKACLALMVAQQRLQQQQQQHQVVAAQMDLCLQKHKAEDMLLAQMRQCLQQQQQQQVPRGSGDLNEAGGPPALPSSASAGGVAGSAQGCLVAGQVQSHAVHNHCLHAGQQQQQPHLQMPLGQHGIVDGNNQLQQQLHVPQGQAPQLPLLQHQQLEAGTGGCVQAHHGQYSQQYHHHNHPPQQQQHGAISIPTQPAGALSCHHQQLQPHHHAHHSSQHEQSGTVPGNGPVPSAFGSAYNTGGTSVAGALQQKLQQSGLMKCVSGVMGSTRAFEGETLAGVVPDLPGLDTMPSLPSLPEAAFNSLLSSMVFN